MVPVKSDTFLPTFSHESITLWLSTGTPCASGAIVLVIILCSRRLLLLSSKNATELTSVASQ